MKLGTVRNVHFVGIGGSGMSGIAEVLLNLGYTVSGSDAGASETTERLTRLGACVRVGHDAANVDGADTVVFSTAIPRDNPELVRARELGIPLIPRAEMLGELMRMKHSIAVAGSHGKTSITAMLALVLSRCGLDPTVVIGGRFGVLGGGAKLGRGDIMVAEADESDGSFMRLFPSIAVVSGIDSEHLDHYGSYEKLETTFVDFLSKVPFYGSVIACADDEGVRRALPRIERRVIRYGIDREAELAATRIETEGFTARFTLVKEGEAETPVRLQTPGRHQVQNALAAIAVAGELGLAMPVAAKALEDFSGVDRRMQRVGEVNGVLVVDDYGHHPREIAATLAALRAAVGDRRIVVLFQPHRYSRTELLFNAFAGCFAQSDALVVTDIYAAGEAPRPGVDAEKLAEAISRAGHRDARFGGPLEDALRATTAQLVEGDVVLTLGAGTVSKVAPRIVESVRSGAGAR